MEDVAYICHGQPADITYFLVRFFLEHLQQDKLLFALMLPLIQLSHQPEGMEFNLSLTDRRELIVGIPETLAEIAKRLEKNAHTPVRRSHSVGRNDPCPCGSGKKYKKCCGAG